MPDLDAVLNFKYDRWDLQECTIREYLTELLLTCWQEGEGFSGKRPFGNSGWQSDVHMALCEGGFIECEFDEDNQPEEWDGDFADQVITAAIKHMGKGPQ